MYKCTRTGKWLVHLTYNIRQALEHLEKDEKAEVPGITIANKFSPIGENKKCTAVRKENFNSAKTSH